MRVNPDTYPTWLKISIVEGALQKMEAPRQVYLTSRASFKLMDAQNRQYLDEAFKIAYNIFYFPANGSTSEEYRKLIEVLIKMWKGE